MEEKKLNLISDTLTLTTSKVLTAAISMVSTMLLARFRTLEEYGTYSQLLLVVNLFTSIFMLGLPNCLNFFLARADTPEDRRKFLSIFYTLDTLLSVIEGVILLLATPLLCSYFKNPAIQTFWYFLLFYPWANIISSTIDNLLIVYRKVHTLMLYRLLYSISFLGIIVLVQLVGSNFTAYIILYVVLLAGFAWLVYYIARRLAGGLHILFDQKMVVQILKLSIPLGLSSIVGTLSIELDKLLIGYMMDTEQLAIYTNAAKELPFTMVASSITAVLMPQLAKLIKKNRKVEAVKLWNCATELSLIILALIVAGVFTFASDVLSFLYSEKYLPGLPVFRVYTLVLILRCTYFGMILNACGRSRQILWCSVLSLVTNVVLNGIFYYLFGMIGPAIATFLSIFLVQMLQLKMTALYTQVPFAKVFPWCVTGKLLVLNTALAVVFYLLKKLLPMDVLVGSFAESVVLGVMWCVVYGFVLRKKVRHLWNKLNTYEM